MMHYNFKKSIIKVMQSIDVLFPFWRKCLSLAIANYNEVY